MIWLVHYAVKKKHCVVSVRGADRDPWRRRVRVAGPQRRWLGTKKFTGFHVISSDFSYVPTGFSNFESSDSPRDFWLFPTFPTLLSSNWVRSYEFWTWDAGRQTVVILWRWWKMPISAAGLAHGEHGEYHVEYYHGDGDDDHDDGDGDGDGDDDDDDDDDDDAGSKCHRSVSAEEVHRAAYGNSLLIPGGCSWKTSSWNLTFTCLWTAFWHPSLKLWPHPIFSIWFCSVASCNLFPPCTSLYQFRTKHWRSRTKSQQVVTSSWLCSMSFHVIPCRSPQRSQVLSPWSSRRPVVRGGTWILWLREGQCPSRWSEIHVFSPMFAGHVPSFYNSQVGELWRITWKNMISHPYLGKDRQSFATSQKHLFPVFFSPMSSMSSIINDNSPILSNIIDSSLTNISPDFSMSRTDPSRSRSRSDPDPDPIWLWINTYIHKSQLFWCELQGDRVLTHPHIPFLPGFRLFLSTSLRALQHVLRATLRLKCVALAWELPRGAKALLQTMPWCPGSSSPMGLGGAGWMENDGWIMRIDCLYCCLL